MVSDLMRLPFGDEASFDVQPITLDDANVLLSQHHYLGTAKSARWVLGVWVDGSLVACQVFRWPTARMLPSDGSWLELSRWCLTPAAGPNAGSKMMSKTRKWIRHNDPNAHTLVSYSDPVHGHSGALYRASGWIYTPTHHSLRYDANGLGYPSGHGSWDGITRQSPKHRWTYAVNRRAAT